MRRPSYEDLSGQHRPAAIRARLGAPYRTEYVSDAVLGAIDGCVTTFAVVSGAAGAGFPGRVALIPGFANLIADDLGDPQHALDPLGVLMQNCVGCHAAFRIETVRAGR